MDFDNDDDPTFVRETGAYRYVAEYLLNLYCVFAFLQVIIRSLTLACKDLHDNVHVDSLIIRTS